MIVLDVGTKQKIEEQGLVQIPLSEDVGLAGWYVIPTSTRSLTPLARANLKRVYETGLWELSQHVK